MDTVGTFRDSEEEMQDFGALLDDYLSFDEPQRGDIREAEIIKIEKSEIVVDVEVKRDGIVPLRTLNGCRPSCCSRSGLGTWCRSTC